MKSPGRSWEPSLAWLGLAALAFIGAGSPGIAQARRNAAAPAASSDHRVSAERAGSLAAAGSNRLNLIADSGSVHIFTDSSDQVRYRVRVEAEAADPDASQLLKQFSVVARRTPRGVELTGGMPKRDDVDRVWVTYEVHLPRRYDLNISTRAGDIETQDTDGRATLSTGGGTIRAGRIGRAGAGNLSEGARDPFVARLETGGGHIFVGDVAGGLRATTAGGHIVAGNVAGDAVLRTDGGHVQVGRVGGTAQLFTGGGNIVAEDAAGGVQADSGGGRIELGEAGGDIRAHTGGGGIRIARLAGPTDLDSSDGGIFLAGVAAPLRAATATGTITAWFSPMFGDAPAEEEPRSDGPQALGLLPGVRRGIRDGRGEAAGSELVSRQGNIIVYLPPEIAVTIDALVEQGDGHRILADPSLPLKVRYEDAGGVRAERGECTLNGGGEVVHLKATGGDIELRVLDPQNARRLAEQQRDAVARRLEMQRAILSDVQGLTAESREEIARAVLPAVSNDGGGLQASEFPAWSRWFDQFWWGGLRVAPEEQQRRLVRSAPPAYPEAAQEAGIEGDVTLRIVVGPDGTVNGVRPVAGDPVLARAATDAVEQWRYAPAVLDGRAVSVVTTVTLAFRLR